MGVVTIALNSELFEEEYPYRVTFQSRDKRISDMVMWCHTHISQSSIGGWWTVCNDYPDKHESIFGFKKQEDCTMFKLTWAYE